MDGEMKERIERQIEINTQEIKMMRVQIERYECANEQLRGLLEEIPQSIVTVGLKAARKALAAHRETLINMGEIRELAQENSSEPLFFATVLYGTEEAIKKISGAGIASQADVRDALAAARKAKKIKFSKDGAGTYYNGDELNKFAAQMKVKKGK